MAAPGALRRPRRPPPALRAVCALTGVGCWSGNSAHRRSQGSADPRWTLSVSRRSGANVTPGRHAARTWRWRRARRPPIACRTPRRAATGLARTAALPREGPTPAAPADLARDRREGLGTVEPYRDLRAVVRGGLGRRPSPPPPKTAASRLSQTERRPKEGNKLGAAAACDYGSTGMDWLPDSTQVCAETSDGPPAKAHE